MDNDQVRKNVYAIPGEEKKKCISPIPLICGILFSIFYVVPIWTDHPTAHSCLAILITAAFAWGTEFIPSYATAYLVPALAIWLQIGYDSELGERIPASQMAVILANKFTDPIIFVFLGSLTISAALTKLEITDRVSAWIMSKISKKPRIVLLVLMLLNYVIAAFLSNVASTTLVLTFSLPIIRSLDPLDPFLKALLFGLAWSGNAGGMPTTISSPQNILAVKYINEALEKPISFLLWMAFAVPTSLLILLFFWVYLIIIYKPQNDEIPPLSDAQSFEKWTWRHTFACVITVLTILLWALNETFIKYLGHVGITSLIPVILFFSVGILDSHDFGTLRWSTLVLMGGGLALGEAMTRSQLLDLLADLISEGLSKVSLYAVLIIILIIEAILTSVINHTSAAAILFPVIQKIGGILGGTPVLLTCAALMISSAQLFHISSFPNALISGVQRHLRMDPSKLTSESFVTGKDFFLVGWPTVIGGLLIIASVGYGIVKAMNFVEK